MSRANAIAHHLPTTRDEATKRIGGPDTGTSTPSKRVRVSRACDQCRAGREKCDGIRPTCNACQAQRRSCSYDEQPKKRGIQPNYIRTLELTLTWLFHAFPRTEARLAELLPDLDGDVHRMIAFKDPARSEELHQVWRSGLVSRQIDQMLSGSAIEIPEASQPTTDDPDTVSALTSSILDLTGQQRTRSPTSTVPLTADHHPAHESSIPREPASRPLRLPPHTRALLDHYFAFTHSWMPITEKRDMFKLVYDNNPLDGLASTFTSNADHAELWSLMALSEYQRSSQNIGSDVEGMMEIARSLIPPKTTGFELGHAKALLIQCLVEMSRGNWPAAWLAVGSAVRIVTYLGSDMKQPRLLQIGRARHTLLAAFVLESVIASQIGAHTHLKRSVVNEIGLPVEDGSEEWSQWMDPSHETGGAQRTPNMAVSTFNKLVKMTVQLQDRNSATVEVAQNRSLIGETIGGLLRNACLSQGRQQPSTLVIDGSAVFVTERDQSGSGISLSEMLFSASDADAWTVQNTPSQSVSRLQPAPSLSVPKMYDDFTGGGDFTSDNPKLNLPSHSVSEQAQSWNWESDVGAGDLFNDDIFGELASLERADESTRPQFMQNLGFGPDLDLAEFFGADYQLSDPLLAHLQT